MSSPSDSGTSVDRPTAASGRLQHALTGSLLICIALFLGAVIWRAGASLEEAPMIESVSAIGRTSVAAGPTRTCSTMISPSTPGAFCLAEAHASR